MADVNLIEIWIIYRANFRARDAFDNESRHIICEIIIIPIGDKIGKKRVNICILYTVKYDILERNLKIV